MGDFFTPPQGFQAPTEPDTPPPDLFNLGLNMAKGLDKSGAVGSWLNGLLDILVRAAGAIAGLFVRIVGSLLAIIVRGINAADEVAAPAYAELVAQELSALFGVSASTASLQGVANAKSRAGLGDQVGAFMVQNIIAPSAPATGSGLTPDDSAAKKFLGSIMTMEVEGWMHSWIFDAFSYHELEKFGDLKDGVARSLGLGRMSRQVFAPPLKVFVHDPYLAKINAAYRPASLPLPSCIRQFFRGELSRQDVSTILGREGWQEKYIDFFINEHQKYLSDAEVEYLISRTTWSMDEGVQYLASQGWDTATAQRRLELMADQRIDRYRREIVAVAAEAFVRGDIPHDQLATIVQASGLTDTEQQWLIRVAGTKRELHVTHLSRGDIERLIKESVLNFGDLEQWAVRNNMPIDEERFLELGLAVQEVSAAKSAAAKADAAKAKQAAQTAKTVAATQKALHAAAQAPDKGISLSEAESLVIDGTWTFEHYNAYLAAREYSADSIAAMDHLLHEKLDKLGANHAAAGAAHAAAGGKSLTVAEMEKATVDGLISTSELRNYLVGAGYTTADAAVLVELVQHQIDQQKLKDQAKAAAASRAGAHGVTLADIDRAVRLGLTPIQTYQTALRAAGYDDAGVTLLTAILTSQMASDQAAAAKRNTASAAAGQRGLSLPELENAIIAGVRPIGDYMAELVKLGYGSADAGDLTKLLQLRVDQAAATAAKRATAGAAAGHRGLSLVDVERAVKLGVLKIADYTAALKAAGFDQASIDVLSNTLKAQIAATAKVQTAANSAATTLQKKGISLVDLERAVVAGVRPIAEYSALLQEQGYPDADVATLTELVRLKIEQAQLAKSRHADAVGLATERGINLAQEEQAVIDGTVLMAEYDALLAALGYDLVDRSILEGLLEKRVEAAQSKAAAAAAKAAAAAPAT